MTKLSALSKTSRKLSDVFGFVEELQTSSDRGFAVLVVTDVDNALTDAIRAFLHPQRRDELLGSNGPCRNFSSKILLGHALGIYGDETFRNLNIIREVRNVFAHAQMPLSFDMPEIANACAMLEIPDRNLPRDFDDPEPDGTDTVGRQRFHVVCQQLSSNLHWQAMRMSQAPSLEDLPSIEAADEFTVRVVGKALP